MCKKLVNRSVNNVVNIFVVLTNKLVALLFVFIECCACDHFNFKKFLVAYFAIIFIGNPRSNNVHKFHIRFNVFHHEWMVWCKFSLLICCSFWFMRTLKKFVAQSAHIIWSLVFILFFYFKLFELSCSIMFTYLAKLLVILC